MVQDAEKSHRHRAYRPQALAKLAARVAKRAYARRGFADGKLLLHWEQIIGPELACRTMPEKVVRGCLHLWVESGALALEIQHLEPQLIERINGYYGYRAVERLRTIQRPLPAKPEPPPEPPALSEKENETLNAEVAMITDPDLREALRGLGSAIRRRRKQGSDDRR